MQLSELIAGLDVRCVRGEVRGVRVCDLTEDSRTVLPGSLFVARRGERADGRRFIDDAVGAGAVVILTDHPDVAAGRGATVLVAGDLAGASAFIAERFYGGPSSRLTLIGVTGTNGKTTTSYLIHRILNDAGVRCGLMGTVIVDDGNEVAPAVLTTPPAMEMSRTLGVMVEAGCRAAVVEVSSHALAQGRVAALNFDIGVFTNLTGDHLDYHGTMESYARAKARLFGMLPEDGAAIINADDPHAEQMVRLCPAPVFRCAAAEGARGVADRAIDCRVRILSSSMHGMRARFSGPWGELESSLNLVGEHNAMNALQALAACGAAGCGSEDLLVGLADASPPPGRLEPVHEPGDPFAVFVDYAHTDDALVNVLRAAGPLTPRRGQDGGGRLVVVFGCGGDRDRTKRPRMGLVAAELADRVIITSDNPRSESPSSIIRQIMDGVPGEHRFKVSVHAERETAIRCAVEEAQPGDVIVIAGKGHETEQLSVDDEGRPVRRHFDDREVARIALARRRAAEVGA